MAYTTINKSTDYFNTKLYTGNGSAGNAITGVGFQPDFTWIKDRDNTRNHVLTDAVRGVTKVINSNTTDAEGTDTSTLTAFGTDGFTLGDGTKVNGNNINFASWNWKAGGGAGSANTDGSINTISTSVNTTAGFSISRYTGTGANATIGHGLGAVPQVVIARNITDTEQWTTYHVGLDASAPEDYHVRLNTTDARVDEASVWNDTAPTSSVFSVGTSGAPNGSGDNHIAYCFAEKKGFSKFGSYTGNGSTDGTFVYTGFKPAWFLVKCTSFSGQSWIMFDNKRDPYNEMIRNLRPNTTDAEDASTSSNDVDFLSNGIKITEDNDNVNKSGATYIYMAFAEAPLVGSNNVPCTAR